MPMSSFAASCCMSCPADFSGSGITAFLPIAVARLSWLAAGSYSLPPLPPSNSPMPCWTIATATNSSPANRYVIAQSAVMVI